MKFRPVRRTILSALFIVMGMFVSIFAQGTPTNPPRPETPKATTSSFDDVWKNYPDKLDLRGADYSDHFSVKWLRRDLRLADVAAYVKVVKRKLVDHTNGADCEQNRGGGYCLYRLTADVRKVYKGNVSGRLLEFFGSSDADFPKDGFMGERVVFLASGEAKPGKPRTLGSMENTTRWIDHNVLAKMSLVTDPTAKIEDNDPDEPYSRVAIEKNFDDSNTVAYVEAVKFRPDPDAMFGTGAIVTATVKEVFKGNLKVGDTVEYREDFLHRDFRNEDLGDQVVYLQKHIPRVFDMMEFDKVSGKTVRKKGEVRERNVVYQNLEYTEGFIKHGILEKLRKIAGKVGKLE